MRLRNAIGTSAWASAGSVAALALCLLVAPEAARAGTYTVFQCSSSNYGSGNPGADPDVQATGKRGGAYVETNSCGTANPAIGIYNPQAGSMGSERRWTWFAPSGTAITRAWMQADLRRHDGYSGRIFTDSGDILTAGGGPYGWVHRDWSFPNPRSAFGVRLVCAWNSGCNSGGSAQGRAYVRHVAFTLRDAVAPRGSTGGAVMSASPETAGWQRGSKSLSFGGSDRGSGVSVYTVDVSGRRLGGAFARCVRTSGGYAARMRPCPLSANTELVANTREDPWRDGLNPVRVCVWDFSGGGNCRNREVRVDNTAPTIQFRSSQDPSDPELVRARVHEPHSGVRAGKIAYAREGTDVWHELATVHNSGELRARVDSEALPPGPYMFRAWAEDRAGNRSGAVATRENGQPMLLRFPLRVETELRAGLGGAQALTIRYGKQQDLTGRLLSADRDPLPFQGVLVSQHYAAGSLESQHVSKAVTDGNGRFTLRLPAGPSREVHVSYPGSRRYRPAAPRELQLTVRSHASFSTSRRRVSAGGSVLFRGKVRHRGTQLPRGGKLIELQVREGARKWGTVREAFATAGDGRYRLRYRFGRFYTRPVTFRFRVKVTREHGWPYKAPVRSRSRRVTVVP